ncbi:MAG: cyclic nucleotide-binding domain-containing protein [Thermodesulfobacteriota bacterium]
MTAENVLTGKMGFLTMGELLQLLNGALATGVLRIVSPYAPEPGLIYFVKGNPINASCMGKNGLPAAYDLFGWVEGDFSFVKSEVTVSPVIKAGLMELVMDGARLLDDGQVKKLGPSREEQEDKKKTEPSDEYAYLPVLKRPVSNYGYVVEEEEIQSGGTIVQEGRHGNWVCVILEGYADVVRETTKGQLRVVRLGPGALVGNISSLLVSGSVRTATLIAATDVILGVLDLQRMHTEFALLSFELRRFAMSLDKRLREVTDRVVETYLETLLPVAEFAKNMKPLPEPEGDANGIRVVMAGTGAVIRQTPKGPVPLARLGKGDCLGSLSHIKVGHEPANAKVYISEDCVVEEADVTSLEHEYEQCSPMVKGILDHVVNSINITTTVACDFSKYAPRK